MSHTTHILHGLPGLPPSQAQETQSQPPGRPVLLTPAQARRLGLEPEPGVEFVEMTLKGARVSVDSLIAGGQYPAAVTPRIDPAVKWLSCYLCHQPVLPNFTNANLAHYADANGSPFCEGTANLHTIDPAVLLDLRKHLPAGHRCTHQQSLGVSYLGCAGCGGYLHVTIREATNFEQRFLTQSAEQARNGLVPVVVTHRENCVAQITRNDLDCNCDPEIVYGTVAEKLALMGAGAGNKAES